MVVEKNHRALILAGALFVVALALYLVTVAPVVTFVDSGELAAAVATHGVSHPSGSPLYLALGELVAKIPAGTLIRRLNSFSAVCAAVAVPFTFLFFLLNVPRQIDPGPRKKAKTKKKQTPTIPKQHQIPEWVFLAGAVAAALSMMTNRALWSTATVTEVYALHACLIAVVAWLMALHVREVNMNPQKPRQHFLALAAFVCGLGAANYPPLAILAPAILVVLWRTEGISFVFRWRRTLIMAACVLAGLLPYALLPLRASQDPLLNWGNPSNWQRFWNHITAQQYSIFLGSPRLNALPDALKLWWTQWPAFIWLLMIPGFFFLRKHRPSAFLFTSVLGLINLLYVLCYDITDVSSAPSDYYVYLLPLCWCSALWIGAGVCWILEWVIDTQFARPAAIGLSILPLIAIPLHWREMDRSGYTYADDFVRSILQSVAPDAIILSPDWTFVSPSMYLQLGESQRADVLVLDGELLRRSWYFPYFRKRAPKLYDACQPSIDAFLVELAKYENKLSYDPNVITEKYGTMLNTILLQGTRLNRPPYVLLNLQAKEANAESYSTAERMLGRPPYVTTGMSPEIVGFGFQWVPDAVAFRLYLKDEFHPLPDVHIPVRPFSSDRVYDNVTTGIIERYADFWRYRGDYYRKKGQDCILARQAYRKSLEIMVEPEAQSGLAACEQ